MDTIILGATNLAYISLRALPTHMPSTLISFLLKVILAFLPKSPMIFLFLGFISTLMVKSLF